MALRVEINEGVVRLHLKSLEIQGFKSFPDKTRLSFGQGLTVVVGPNGSGKSNISDAVRWVLGEQSTKSLRGSKMEDVIFSGTKNRKPQGMAQVSLTIDNTSRQLPVDADEVTVTRRLYRSGESEYRINNAAVRLRDIYEIFMDTGLGRDGYSIIGQGRIAEIVSARDKERREIFEEAAGISKFRYRKGEAEKRLSMAEDNLSRLADILSELEGRVEPLRRQSEKARRFLELSDEKKILELSIWIDDLEEGRKKLSDQENKIQLMRRQYGQLESQTQALEQQINDLYRQTMACSTRVERCRASIHEREQKIADNRSEAAVRRNDIDHAQRDIQRLEEEIEAGKLLGGLLGKRIEHLEKLLEADNAQIAENLANREAIASTIEKLRHEEQESVNAAAKLVLRRQQMLGEQSQAQADAITAASLIEEAKNRIEQLTVQLGECDNSIERMQGEQSQFDALEKAALQQEQSLTNVLRAVEMKTDTRQQALQKQVQQEQTMQREIDGLHQRASLLEAMEQNHEGFQNSVRFLLRQAKNGVLRGIRGSVSDIITVRNDCALAIETALGASIQNVVVDNEDAAKKAIGMLKRENAGRATLLPLTTVRGSVLDKRSLGREPSFVGLGCDLVSYAPEYQGIVYSLLGRIAVVSDLDSATEIARKNGFKFRIVTLDGQLINAGGSFTGGSVAKNAGLLSRRGEMDALRRQAAEKQKAFETLIRSGSGLRQDLQKLAQTRRETEDQLRIAREDIIRAQSEQHRVVRGLEEAHRQYETVTHSLEDTRKRLEELTSRNVDADSVLERYRQELQMISDQEKENDEQRLKLRQQLDFHTAQENEKRVESMQLSGQMQLHQQEKERLIQQRDDQVGVLERSRQQIQEQNDRIQVAREDIQSLECATIQMQHDNKQDEQTIEETNRLRMDLEEQSTKARSDSRAQSEQKESMARDLARLEEQQNHLQTSYDQIVASMWDEYQLTRSEAAGLVQPLENKMQAQGQLAEIKGKIRELGSVNLSALEEYKEVNERYLFLKKQTDDARAAKEELEKLIYQLTGQMETTFADSFKHISANFSKIFVDLFGGGSASLKLTDPEHLLESGIEIFVEPPGKIIKNLGLLSGGEQSFVAIAIYFAILKYRPAAFCLLDEIEAALDDVNVDRFAQYLKRLGNETQFISITHRRGTMEEADILYGVTMQEEGVSKLLELDVTRAVDLTSMENVKNTSTVKK